MSTGLSGTPMPSFSDTVSEEDRWALSYFVLSLSAFKDPLTGQPIQHHRRPTATRLNDPALLADESQARLPQGLLARGGDRVYAGAAWAKKHGFDFAEAARRIRRNAGMSRVRRPRWLNADPACSSSSRCS